jgi:hypothetical protein
MKKINFLQLTLLPLLVATFFTACGDTTTTPVIKEAVSLEITAKNRQVYTTSDGIEYKAEVTFDDGSKADATHSVIWEVADYSKATVTAGIVAAHANVSDTVGVSVSYGDLSDDDYVTLIPFTNMWVNDPLGGSDTALADHQYIFSATATYADGTTQDIKEGNSKNIEWSVEGDATIDNADNGIATITFTSGSATVTLTVFDQVIFSKTYNTP